MSKGPKNFDYYFTMEMDESHCSPLVNWVAWQCIFKISPAPQVTEIESSTERCFLSAISYS